MDLPFTVMTSPLTKPAESEAEPEAPTNVVELVTGCGVACWSVEAAPVTEPEVPIRNGGCTAVIVLPAGPKPSAASAFFALVSEAGAEIEKLAPFGVFSVTAPLSMLEGVEVPVIESIADNRLPTVPDAVLMT
jgi:hypothetical protein